MSKKLFSVLRRLACTGPQELDSPLVWRTCDSYPSPSVMTSSTSGSVATRATELLCDEDIACDGFPAPMPFVACAEETCADLGDVQEQLQLMLKRECPELADREWLVAQDAALIQMRSRLVGWLRAATMSHNYSIITLEHAVNFLDRFVVATGFQDGNARRLELVAVAAFSLAAKMEEVYVPSLGDQLQLAAPWPRFSTGPIERMELTMLLALDWRLACVTPSDLLQPILSANASWLAAWLGSEAADSAGAAAEAAGCAGAPRFSRAQMGSQIRVKAKGVLAASIADPELTRFKACEVAAASLILGVYEVCPSELAHSVQSAVLTRFPQAGACLPALLPYCMLPCHPSTPARLFVGSPTASEHGKPAATDCNAGDTPAAKRACREHTPTSVLDLL